jgi:hypothetical protein
MPDRLRSLVEGYTQINGQGWRPLLVYLGEHEWQRFETESVTGEWQPTDSPSLHRFEYKPNQFIDVRLLAGEKRYIKMFGDKK